MTAAYYGNVKQKYEISQSREDKNIAAFELLILTIMFKL